jgi:DNA-binding NtrC family response regulator
MIGKRTFQMSSGKILAIDDEQFIRRLILNEFSLEGFDVITAESGEEGLSLFNDHYFDLVLLDIKLPRMDGVETLRRIKEISTDTEVIMITGFGDIKSAVDCLKLGAADYVTKPFKLDELLALARQVISRKQLEKEIHKKTIETKGVETSKIVYCPSKAMKKVYEIAARVAPSDSTILIQGETGVGKDMLAQQIHLSSARKDGSFITLDCGLLSRNLAESELYGHRKGAFSGASETKIGLVERSDQGTLFLDEIGNIDLELQKKFLRFLETRRFRRVGDTKETQVNTRIILATNMDLYNAMEKGEIRKDLLYRMDVISILVPPLRERPEDIPVLANHFLDSHPSKIPGMKLMDKSLETLIQYSWPGNVRELKSVINKILILSDALEIKPEDLPPHLIANRRIPTSKPKSLEELEKAHIISVLEETGGNQSKAADILGINRKTLYKKIHKYRIFK